MCCSSVKAEIKCDGFPPYLHLRDREREKNQSQEGGCSAGDLGVSSSEPCVYDPTELNSFLCVTVLVLAFKFYCSTDIEKQGGSV